jgi:hypothetical protein
VCSLTSERQNKAGGQGTPIIPQRAQWTRRESWLRAEAKCADSKQMLDGDCTGASGHETQVDAPAASERVCNMPRPEPASKPWSQSALCGGSNKGTRGQALEASSVAYPGEGVVVALALP